MKLIAIKIFYILILTIGFTTNAFASSDDSPVKMLNIVASSVIDQLHQAEKKVARGEEIPLKTVRNIVNSILLPHVDLDHISRAVLGRNTWAKATVSQKQEFKQQFTELLINTYASGLAVTFNKQHIEFFPIRGGYQGKTIVQVNSKVYPQNASPLSVVYNLERKNGQWLIYDMNVDGISLVQSYKAQFLAIIENEGLQGILTTLVSHNKARMAKHRQVSGSS